MSVHRFDGVPVVTAEGTVDLRTGPTLARAITAALAPQPADVVIDLSGVGFMAAAGVHVLLDAQHNAGASTRLRVLAPDSLLRIVTITELDQVLAVYPALSAGTCCRAEE